MRRDSMIFLSENHRIGSAESDAFLFEIYNFKKSITA